MLEAKDYTFLKERALRKRQSLSETVRELVARARQEETERIAVAHDPVLDIIGCFSGSGEAVGRNAEDILYGNDR
jgi:hypothetical protein